MGDRLGSGKSNNSISGGNKLHSGLKNRAAKWPDSSTKLYGNPASDGVNRDTTRSSTASTPKTLGPRTA